MFWVAATVWAGLSWGATIGVPIGFGVMLYPVVWAIGGFLVKEQPLGQTFDLRELRQNLAATLTDNPEVYKTELEPYLNQLEAKDGNILPIAEVEGLQQLVQTKLADIGKRKQEIIDRGAGEGKTIEIDALRRTMEASKAPHTGPDRDASASGLDRLLDSLTARYGTAFRLTTPTASYRTLRRAGGLRRDMLWIYCNTPEADVEAYSRRPQRCSSGGPDRGTLDHVGR